MASLAQTIDEPRSTVVSNVSRLDVDSAWAAFERRVLSLRGFDAEGMMADAVLAHPGEADAAIRELFENPEIATIHAHNATRGCFSAKIERA